MIKKLRRKFVIINMLFVFAVLVCVFVAVLISYSQTLSDDIRHALMQSVEQQIKLPKINPDGTEESKPNNYTEAEKNMPKERDMLDDKTPKFIAVYSFIMNENGYPTKTIQSSSIIDSGDLNDIAAAINNDEYENFGVMGEYNLYYYKHRLADGQTAVALADSGYYTSSMATMLFYCIAIVLLILIALFFISLFLSKWALKPVEKAWTQQKQFIADASHELKTPLTVILANTKILLRKKDCKISEQLQWVESTEEEAENMKKLVESLLFLARSDAQEQQQSKLPVEAVSISELTENIVLQFEPVAYERRIELDSEIEENITISGDPAQLRQLLQILLDNACKYSEGNGKILVTLKKGSLTVFNSGKPIPEESLPHIFERFYRSDSARSDSGSFGLGLSIAKRIALNHGGDLTAQSSDEIGGTRFIFSFA